MTRLLTDRITEHLARPVRPPVYVEIVDPSGRVSYRRWSDHPDVQEALGTQGYTVRRCPQQPDLDGEAHPGRALLTDALAELRAQAEALARAGQADRLIREWFAEMVGVEKAEGEYWQDQTLGDALTQAHTRKLRAEIKLATYAAPSAAATFGLTESNMDAALGANQ